MVRPDSPPAPPSPRLLGGECCRPQARRARPSETAGFTLIELLISMVMTLVVFGAISTLMIEGFQDQTSVENRAAQMQQAQLAIQVLVRNLREATSVSLPNSYTITYSDPVTTGFQSATFACSSTTDACTNTTGGVTKTVVTDVVNTNVFTATPTTSPTYIGITLSVSAQGQTPLTVTDGTGLRNVTLGT
jgi:Tfp pilus assembly protein PilW